MVNGTQWLLVWTQVPVYQNYCITKGVAFILPVYLDSLEIPCHSYKSKTELTVR